MGINRILEVDVDTERNPMTLVRTVITTPHREGLVPHEPNIKEDMVVLVQGLLACILNAEQSEDFEKGAAMKRVRELLDEGYVDASCEAKEARFDEKGNQQE